MTDEILRTAREAALSAADILIQNFGKIQQNDIRTKQANDFLTFVDEQSEQAIIRLIRDKFPDHQILAEESGRSEGGDEYQWIIDPLDGTRNYISGIPVFAVSIAVQCRGQLLAAVIYDPVHKDLYYATADGGAYQNDRKIKVNNQVDLPQTLIATGFPFRYKQHLDTYLACFRDIFIQVSGIRRMGAAAIDLAYVACGKFAGFWELGLNPWDTAAGTLIIREAGGKVSDFWGRDDIITSAFLVASNGLIHKELVSIIRGHYTQDIIEQFKGES